MSSVTDIPGFAGCPMLGFAREGPAILRGGTPWPEGPSWDASCKLRAQSGRLYVQYMCEKGGGEHVRESREQTGRAEVQQRQLEYQEKLKL